MPIAIIMGQRTEECLHMTKSQAKKIFDTYNPADGIVRCPNGRAKMRKPLDLYAQAAVNLYAIIRLDEFVEIFNAQNEEKTSADEVYTLLLPNVRKSGWYGFYKDYIVHYFVLHDFDWFQYFEQAQAGKPRYIPAKEQFLEYEWEGYDEFNYWQDVCQYMLKTFSNNGHILEAFHELKDYLTISIGVQELGEIIQKYNLGFEGAEKAQEFFDKLMLAANNTRKWVNKGYTPNELRKLSADRGPQELVMNEPIQVRPNDPCPCGSGRKYKNCCAPIETSGAAQISPRERKFFYETWYKLLNFINKKYGIFGDLEIKPVYPAIHDETELYKIRDKLWESPQAIGEFVNSTSSLSGEEISLLQSWEKRHIKGTFLLEDYEPHYAVLVLMGKGETSKLYAVKGMTTSIAEAMHQKLPVMLDTVLLPFGDKIIYDSFLIPYAVDFGDGIRKKFKEEYASAKETYGIITKL